MSHSQGSTVFLLMDGNKLTAIGTNGVSVEVLNVGDGAPVRLLTNVHDMQDLIDRHAIAELRGKGKLMAKAADQAPSNILDVAHRFGRRHIAAVSEPAIA